VFLWILCASVVELLLSYFHHRDTEYAPRHREKTSNPVTTNYKVRVTFESDRGLSGSRPFASANNAANSCAGMM